MIDHLFNLRLFVRVARLRSFSGAAKELGLSQPSVSRLIAILEKEVGTSLLMRTTRGVSVTEAGADYLLRIEPILIALEEADHAARGTGELRGELRIAVSTSFAVREVMPRLPSFMKQHPALRIAFQMSDHRQDLVIESIDVALRFGELGETNAVARRLGTAHRLLVAAPGYLAEAGHPQSPSDLAEHALILGPTGMGHRAWAFSRDGRTLSIRAEGRITTTVNQGAIAAAVAGLGIISTADWDCRAELASGALVRVLPEWEMEAIQIHALVPAGHAAKPAAKAFIDHLAKTLDA